MISKYHQMINVKGNNHINKVLCVKSMFEKMAYGNMFKLQSHQGKLIFFENSFTELKPVIFPTIVFFFF